MRSPYSVEWSTRRLEMGRRTLVMGIVNVTPDSFSDGGRFNSVRDAVEQGVKLAQQGADIVDIGGESTRPYSDPVPVSTELERVIPVITELSRRISIPISIDTTKSEVAQRAVAAGAAIINDVSAFRIDPRMPHISAACKVPVIVMHMKGAPKTMQVAPEYDDLFQEIILFLQNAVEKAMAAGIPRSRIIIDPGLGFGKTFTHNLELLNHLDRLKVLDLPILVGSSRKAFIRHLLKVESESDLDPLAPAVQTGTQATVAAAIMKGAHMVRVHDVEQTLATVKIVDAVLAS